MTFIIFAGHVCPVQSHFRSTGCHVQSAPNNVYSIHMASEGLWKTENCNFLFSGLEFFPSPQKDLWTQMECSSGCIWRITGCLSHGFHYLLFFLASAHVLGTEPPWVPSHNCIIGHPHVYNIIVLITVLPFLTSAILEFLFTHCITKSF